VTPLKNDPILELLKTAKTRRTPSLVNFNGESLMPGAPA
jgi:hypothetical protein